MPTAAKLVAAVCLAVLGFAVSEIIKTLMPASTDFGMFSIVNTVLGFICGWRVIGTRAGRGQSAAVSNGFTGTVALVFFGLFIQATNEMVRLAFARRYDTPIEAIGAIFELGIEYGQVMLDVQVLIVLFLGGIVAGLLAEVASRRWR